MGKLYFSKYQFFSENPNEKVQAKSKCNVKANKFREILGSWEDLTELLSFVQHLRD